MGLRGANAIHCAMADGLIVWDTVRESLNAAKFATYDLPRWSLADRETFAGLEKMNTTYTLVQKHGNCGNVLRDAGMRNGKHVEQLEVQA